MADDRAIEEIRSRIDIVDLIGSRITLKKAGATYKACCPFHNEKTPSFNVNPMRQFYHCFGCGESGDVFSFIMKMDGLTFGEALKVLAEKTGVQLGGNYDDGATRRRKRLYSLHSELAEFYRRCLKSMKDAEPARAYLAKRKIPDEIAEEFRIGFAPASPKNVLSLWAEKHGYSTGEMVDAGILLPPKSSYHPNDFYDRFKGRLMFPICDSQGRVVAFSGRILDKNSHPAKYVNSPETEIFTKGKVLYALDKAARHIVREPRREAIICEGQIDVIRCHACGFRTAVASEGTAFTKEHAALLKRHADSVVLLFDADNAGKKAAVRTGEIFLANGIPVRVASLPPGEDPDSFLRDKGAEAFRQVLADAASITAFQIVTLRSAEAKPDSVDAVSRISKAALSTIAHCNSAVMRSHLLQEASELLAVPVEALESDLSSAPPPPPPSPPPPVEVAEEQDIPEPVVPPPDKSELLLCEFMVEFDHDQSIHNFFAQCLKPDMLVHQFAREFSSAFVAGKLTAFCKDCKEEWKPLLLQVVEKSQKMISAKEFSKEDAAKDFVRSTWLRASERRRAELPPGDAESLSLSITIRLLTSAPWNKIRNIVGSTEALEQAMAPEEDAIAFEAPPETSAPSAQLPEEPSPTPEPEEIPSDDLFL